MSSMNLNYLIDNFPQERETISKFEDFLEKNSDKNNLVFTLERLYENIHPSSTFLFAQLLNQLVSHGILEKIVRVESPTTGMGLKDFSSITEIPDHIYDFSQDIDINVKPDSIKILYRLPKNTVNTK